MIYRTMKLSRRFPLGTIGYGLCFRTNHFVPSFSKVERNVLDAFESEDEPDPNEILREMGFYDSSDPRACINRKRE